MMVVVELVVFKLVDGSCRTSSIQVSSDFYHISKLQQESAKRFKGWGASMSMRMKGFGMGRAGLGKRKG